MGSREKAMQLMDVLDQFAQFKQLVPQMVQNMIDNDLLGVDFSDSENQMVIDLTNNVMVPYYERMLSKVKEFMADMYAEDLTDEELDAAIAFHSSPVAKKIMNIGMNRSQELIPFLSQIATEEMNVLEEQITQFVDDYPDQQPEDDSVPNAEVEDT